MELCILCFFFFFLCFKLFYGKFFAMPPPHTREKKKTLVNYKPVLPVCIHQHGTPLCTFIKHWKVLFLVNLITFFPCPIDFWESKKKKKSNCVCFQAYGKSWILLILSLWLMVWSHIYAYNSTFIYFQSIHFFPLIKD